MVKTLPFTQSQFAVTVGIIVFVVSLTYLLFFNDDLLLTVGVIISGIILLFIIRVAMHLFVTKHLRFKED